MCEVSFHIAGVGLTNTWTHTKITSTNFIPVERLFVSVYLVKQHLIICYYRNEIWLYKQKKKQGLQFCFLHGDETTYTPVNNIGHDTIMHMGERIGNN